MTTTLDSLPRQFPAPTFSWLRRCTNFLVAVAVATAIFASVTFQQSIGLDTD